MNTLGILGISLRNSFFTDNNCLRILEEKTRHFPERVLMLLELSARVNYVALGYPESKIHRDIRYLKAKLSTFFDVESSSCSYVHWHEIATNPLFVQKRKQLERMYISNDLFRASTQSTTQQFLIPNLEKRPSIPTVSWDEFDYKTHIAKDYLLDELAFLLTAQEIYRQKVSYIYHKPWPIFEEIIKGDYPELGKISIDFELLSEN